MKLRRLIAMMMVLAMFALSGCAPAASDAAKSNTAETSQTPSESQAADAAAAPAGEYESLDTVDIAAFKNAPVISDYVPEDCNLSGTKADGTKWKIAWCSPDDADESMAYMTQLHKQIAEEYGFELICFDAQSDVQKQTDHINNAVTQGCDAVIVNPIDASALSIPMKKAKDAGLLVINSQNLVNDPEAYDHYVGPDDLAAGQMAASMLMEALPDGGKIVMIDGMMGSTAQINRTAGFRGVMQNYPEYEILEEQTANWSTTDAMNVMEAYLAKYPEIDAVFSHFDLATLAAIQSTENVSRADKIKFFSVDGTQGALDAIAEGSCFYGTCMQDFYTNSEIQIFVALAHLNGDGEKLAKDIFPPYICIEADNAANFTAGWG